jgi:hypothetical protein
MDAEDVWIVASKGAANPAPTCEADTLKKGNPGMKPFKQARDRWDWLDLG